MCKNYIRNYDLWGDCMTEIFEVLYEDDVDKSLRGITGVEICFSKSFLKSNQLLKNRNMKKLYSERNSGV
jgi:hypothetical protein